MLVDLAGGADGVVVFGVAFGHFEGGAWHDHVAGVGGARPFLCKMLEGYGAAGLLEYILGSLCSGIEQSHRVPLCGVNEFQGAALS